MIFTDDFNGQVGKGFEDQHGGKGCGRRNQEFARTLDPSCVGGLALKEKGQQVEKYPRLALKEKGQQVEKSPRLIIFWQRYQT